MKKLLVFIPFLLFLSPLFASAYTISGAADNNQNGVIYGGTGTSEMVGQQITTVAAGTFSSLTFSLGYSGTPVDNVEVSVYSDSGGAVGTLIESSNAVVGTTLASFFAGNPAPATFTFSSPVTVTANTAYWLVVTRTGSRSTSNYYVDGGDGSGNTTGFNYAFNSSGTWHYSGAAGAWDNVSIDVTASGGGGGGGGGGSISALTAYASSTLATYIGSSPDGVVAWMWAEVGKPILGGALLALKEVIPILITIGILSVLVFIGYRLWSMWRGK